MTATPLYAGLDWGGTSVKGILGTGPEDIAGRFQVPTATPETTIAEVIDSLANTLPADRSLAGIGISAFGPINRDPTSPDYGTILDTPKPGWQQTDIMTPLREAFGVPVALDTDVNGALLGEASWGAAQGLTRSVYITIGTGVGGGILDNGKFLAGPGHPELGHLRLQRLAEEQAVFAGTCPFHGDCIEGLVSAPALIARWGMAPDQLDDNHQAWVVAAHDLAQLSLALTYIVRPDRIILGGGVSQRSGLIEAVGRRFENLTSGYALHPSAADTQSYIVRPKLDQDAGALGGIKMIARTAS